MRSNRIIACTMSAIGKDAQTLLSDGLRLCHQLYPLGQSTQARGARLSVPVARRNSQTIATIASETELRRDLISRLDVWECSGDTDGSADSD